ncbi:MULTISPECIES: transglutaminase domain-containing protein [Croceibacter]|uniref:transglutaminase domain-containing protein n=1 Tax=Croceibacter TaxID=216431 RepID=UPI000C599EC3|nr:MULTISPECIES: transglutaminase domain-containing protein [Croceibacter]MBG26660.1 transglutaminase [Croceibacter sp.]|tara:strand:- start:17832 stop:19865 length:2034 start_codon:yes stop_codon:yes gene_type:complete
MKLNYAFTILLTFSLFTSLLAQDYDFGDVSEEELLEKEHPIYKDADAAILYRSYNTYFTYTTNEGFLVNTEVHERIKIYNPDGYKYATKSVSLYEQDSKYKDDLRSLKAYTYNLENGNISKDKLSKDGVFKEEQSKYRTLTKFTMPNLKEGCVIEYKYLLKTPFVSNLDEFRFQEQIPINTVSSKFRSPEYYGFNMHQKGLSQISIENEVKSRTIIYKPQNSQSRKIVDRVVIHDKSPKTRKLTFSENIINMSGSQIPAIKEELYTNNIDNYSNAIKFELAYINFPGSTYKNYSNSWDDVAKSIFDQPQFGDELKKSNYFNNDLSRLISSQQSEIEKTVAIYEFVKQKMNWNGYVGIATDDGVRSAYKNNVGNITEINLILTAMLREAGLNTNPVLLSTKNHGIPIFPTRNGFNYVISSVTIDGGLVLLDASKKYGEINLLEEELLNWNGRLITEDGRSKWVNLLPNKQAEQNTMLSVTIDKDLNTNAKVINKLTGHKSYAFKKKYANVAKVSQLEMFENQFKNIQVSNLEVQNLDKLYQPISFNYDVSYSNALDIIDSKIYVTPLLHLGTYENPFVPETRQYPVDFVYPLKTRVIASIKIPDGYTVETIPETLNIAIPKNQGSFQYLVNVSGNNIQVSSQLSISTHIIASNYYKELKAFYDMVINKQLEKIVLVKS